MEKFVNYGTDAFGAHCGHILSAMVRIHLKGLYLRSVNGERERERDPH